jgi:hypothetical protein
MTRATVSLAAAMTCLTVLAFAGCVPQASPPRPAASPALATTTSLPPEAAAAAMQGRLASLGFGVAVDPGGIIRAEIAEGAPVEWVACERLLIENHDGIVRRAHWADPRTRRIWLQVRIAEAGGRTSVTLSPYYEGIYVNRFNFLELREPCASTGQLEPMLLAAVGGA